MTMRVPMSGGCACGAVRYECSAAPLASFNCHCRDCQRETGSAFAAIIMVPTAAFRVVRGEPRYFGVKADSGFVTKRAFCAECGSSLFGDPERVPALRTIRVGSLDDPSGFHPARDIYTASAQPWDFMNPDLPKSPRLPD
jgi:hypothetical protein